MNKPEKEITRIRLDQLSEELKTRIGAPSIIRAIIDAILKKINELQDLIDNYKPEEIPGEEPQPVVVTIEQKPNETITVICKGKFYTKSFTTVAGEKIKATIKTNDPNRYKAGKITNVVQDEYFTVSSSVTISATPAIELLYSINIIQSDHQTITVTHAGTDYTESIPEVPYGTIITARVESTSPRFYSPGKINISSPYTITTNTTIFASPATYIKQKINISITNIYPEDQFYEVYVNGVPYFVAKGTKGTIQTEAIEGDIWEVKKYHNGVQTHGYDVYWDDIYRECGDVTPAESGVFTDYTNGYSFNIDQSRWRREIPFWARAEWCGKNLTTGTWLGIGFKDIEKKNHSYWLKYKGYEMFDSIYMWFKIYKDGDIKTCVPNDPYIDWWGKRRLPKRFQKMSLYLRTDDGRYLKILEDTPVSDWGSNGRYKGNQRPDEEVILYMYEHKYEFVEFILRSEYNTSQGR